jgi:hypothetical protein
LIRTCVLKGWKEPWPQECSFADKQRAPVFMLDAFSLKGARTGYTEYISDVGRYARVLTKIRHVTVDKRVGNCRDAVNFAHKLA